MAIKNRIYSAFKRHTYSGTKSAYRLWWKSLEKVVKPAYGTSIELPGWLRPEWMDYMYHHGPWLENYFYIYWSLNKRQARSLGWKYIPLYWTDFYFKHRKDSDNAKSCLKKCLLPEIDTSENYFTIVQQADGVGVELPENVVVFAAGGTGDIPVPLSKPGWFNRNRKKDIRISFMGHLGGANNITGVRDKMFRLLKNDKDCHFGNGTFFEFKDIIERSLFSLCPRGYGRTSFRLVESMAAGSIPIYIWDDIEWLPYKELLDWDKIAISINVSDLEMLPSLLGEYDDVRIKDMQKEIAQVYDQYFSIHGIAERISDMLNECAGPNELKHKYGIKQSKNNQLH